jgi:hypothetical protein
MKKNIFRIAALILFASAISSCSFELRGHDRPWGDASFTPEKADKSKGYLVD